MDARLTLTRRAERSLDVQYYLLQNDATGRTLMRAMRDASLRGVRVRVLVDDLYTASSDEVLLELAAYPNIEVRLFNPFPAGRAFGWSRWTFSITDFARVNHRMHNKLFIADGAFAIAGGRNIADEYFFHSREGNFIDFDLLIAGQAVPRLAAAFDAYWNSSRVYPLEALERSTHNNEDLQREFEARTAGETDAFPALPNGSKDLLGYAPLSQEMETLSLRLLPGAVVVLVDDPERKVSGRSEHDDDRTTVTARVVEAMQSCKADLLLISPYFIPGTDGLEAIRKIRANGTNVSVITNTLAANDEPFASAAYSRYRVPMLRMGVSIFEISSKELRRDEKFASALKTSIGRSHAKVLVCDRHMTFVGSMNLDFRSARENTEIGLLVESRELADDVLAMMDTVKSVGMYHVILDASGERAVWVTNDGGSQQRLYSEPEVDIGTRLKIWLFSPFISESLL